MPHRAVDFGGQSALLPSHLNTIQEDAREMARAKRLAAQMSFTYDELDADLTLMPFMFHPDALATADPSPGAYIGLRAVYLRATSEPQSETITFTVRSGYGSQPVFDDGDYPTISISDATPVGVPQWVASPNLINIEDPGIHSVRSQVAPNLWNGSLNLQVILQVFVWGE